jgi:hypothetical protein
LLPQKAKRVAHYGIIEQDTVRQKIIVRNDSLDHLGDTSLNRNQHKTDSIPKPQLSLKRPEPKIIIEDTTSVCLRPKVGYVDFSDSTNFIFSLNEDIAYKAPLTLTTANKEFFENNRALLLKSLKEGKKLPANEVENDWILPIVLLCFVLIGLVRTIPGNVFRSLANSLLLRDINETSPSDTGILFQWQSTLLNLSSFISISLFGFLLLRNNDIIPLGIKGFLLWVICLVIIIIAVTVRHFTCIVTGNISSESELFRDYLISIYNSYRTAGMIFLILISLILYTSFLPVDIYFKIGLVVAGILYFLRIIRLILIFIGRHISIFYLILYLCALEFLPVLIIVKYVTGLV